MHNAALYGLTKFNIILRLTQKMKKYSITADTKSDLIDFVDNLAKKLMLLAEPVADSTCTGYGFCECNSANVARFADAIFSS